MESTPPSSMLSRAELIVELIKREIYKHRSTETMVAHSIPFSSDPLFENAILILIGFEERQRNESLFDFYHQLMEQTLGVKTRYNEYAIYQMAVEVYKQLLHKYMEYTPG